MNVFPKISVIVPCYCVEKYIDRCLNTIVNQTLQDIEIILVDDLSPDNVPEMCDAWARKDERIKVIHKEKNEGLGYARNSGLEIATGEYVAFVDSDDFIDVRMYETLYEKANKGNIDVVLCNCIQYKNDDSQSCRLDVRKETTFIGREQIDDFLLDMVGPLPEYPHDVKYMMSVWHGIYKRSIFTNYNVSFVSERDVVSEDMIFNLDYYCHVTTLRYLPDCFYYYCYNETSLSHNFSKEKYLKYKKFLSIVEYKLSHFFCVDKYRLHLERFKFLYLRTAISQVMHTKERELSVIEIINDVYWKSLLEKYPYNKMNYKHQVVFFLIKFKMIFLLRFII